MSYSCWNTNTTRLIVSLLHFTTCFGETVLEIPIVGMEMSDVGLHRELTYTMQFDYPLAGRECEYVLEQRLPAAIYVNVDQLEDLKRLKILKTIHPKFIDIEASTERALPFSVLLRGVPKITDTIVLPIHFRYHAADNKNSSVIVNIDTPTLYMHCLAENNDWLELELEQLQTVPNSKYCLNTASSSFTLTSSTPVTTHLSLDEQQDDCYWRMIKAQFQLKSVLSAHIPIGNKEMLTLVVCGTIALSWLAALWLMSRTCTVPRRINHKLKEQHALEQKIK